jgi:hypothetical protein
MKKKDLIVSAIDITLDAAMPALATDLSARRYTKVRLLPRPSTTGQVSTLAVTSAVPSSFRPGTGLAVRPFLHDILERRRVPHYTFKVLRTRQRYFCFLAIPDMTLRFNLALRPAMRLRRRSSAANYAAGVFIRASQGVSTKKTHTSLAYLKLYGIVYITDVCRADK